jgi:hypothetical protein
MRYLFQFRIRIRRPRPGGQVAATAWMNKNPLASVLIKMLQLFHRSRFLFCVLRRLGRLPRSPSSPNLLGGLLCLVLAIASSSVLAGAERSGRGFTYKHDEDPAKPWSIHIVKVQRSSPELELQTTLGLGTKFGLTTLSEQIKTLPPGTGRAVAGINGDYYRTENPYIGDPKGLQIVRGEVVSGPAEWTCFWIDGAGEPHMTNVLSRFEVTWPNGQKLPFGLNEERTAGTAVLFTSAIGTSTRTSGGTEIVLGRHGTNTWLPLKPGQTFMAEVREVREAGDTPVTKDQAVLSIGSQALSRLSAVNPGTVLQLSTATVPDLNGASTAIGGGPALVRAGKVIGGRNDANVRHPRAAVGWNKDFFFLVEVDGRQRNLSVGMTVPELSEYLIKLGCQEAMSLDGGGSATFWVYGQVMNSPSEGRERGMANALVVVQKEKK